MGLLDKLVNKDSNLTPFDGATPSTNPLATAQSKMHDSYSITGQNAGAVNSDYQQYLDGVNNLLPTPSQLDLGGQIPPIAPQFFNNSTAQKLPYTLNQPQ
jgi:hypothetical protein